MSTQKNLITLCIATVFTLGLAACGGGGGGGSSPVTIGSECAVLKFNVCRQCDRSSRRNSLARDHRRLIHRGVVRKRYTPEQIISMLREAEVALAQGQSVGQACRTLGVSEQSYYRWRKEYGGLRTDQAKRLKDLEKENGRLRKAISDLTLDKLILKEALEGNC